MPDSARTLADRYDRDGYAFPLTAMTEAEAAAVRRDLEAAERRAEGRHLGNKGQFNFPHVLFPFAYRIVSNPAILDAVEAVIGPDILLWGSTFFIKEPWSESYVSWHQDLRYWGLSGDDEVSAWLAVGPVTEANGCMRFVPGSHKGGMLEHADTFDETNILTRGQEALVDIKPEDEVPVTLRPGEFSLHHGKLLHASGPNRSDERRIGYTMNFIRPDMAQLVAKRDFAMLMRGEDRYGNFTLVPPPKDDLTDEAMAWHARILDAQNQAMYDGAEDAAR
jgi:non-heme Fe2+,alpha-ketoglutarate-dependent halogenase